MSLLDPQPGETFVHPTFGGGCEVSVVKRGIRKGWGDAVWFELRRLDGRAVSHPLRIWKIEGWPNLAAGFAVTHQEKP